MAQQPRLDVVRGEWLSQEGIVLEVDLADGQIVRCLPVAMNVKQLVFGERARSDSVVLLGDGRRGLSDGDLARDAGVEHERGC
jgi:hypothetical protein